MRSKRTTVLSGLLCTILVPAAFGQSGWNRVDLGGFSSIPTLSFLELPKEVMLIGTRGHSILRSSDDGAHWTECPVVTSNEDVWNLAVTNAGTVLAATGGSKGICRSTDGGATFTGSNVGLLTIRAAAFGVHPDSKWIFAATFGVYRSSDDGKHWLQANEGLEGRGTTCFAFDEEDGMYVGADGGLYYSGDEGVSWKPRLKFGLDTSVTSILLTENAIYAGTNRGGVMVSQDDGETWSPFSTGIGDTEITSLLDAGSFLFAGTKSGGAYISKPGSNEWTSLNKKLLGQMVYQFIVGKGNTLFAVTDSGLFGMAAASGVSNATSEEPLGISVESRRVTLENPQRELVCLSIFDVMGRAVARKESADLQLIANLDALPAGCYFLRVTTPGSVNPGKLTRLELR